MLAQQATFGNPQLGSGVVPTVFATVVVFELAGAICVQAGLSLAGEADPVAT